MQIGGSHRNHARKMVKPLDDRFSRASLWKNKMDRNFADVIKRGRTD
jgi:hypothetical protein